MDIELYQDPFDYPDWRWTRVKELLSENKEPTQKDDKFVHRAYQFRKELRDSDGSSDSRVAIASKYRDVSKAVGLWNNKNDRKHYIEAFSLCPDFTDEQIAEYMGEHPNTIRYYIKLFFDIRHKLGHIGYICSRILEPSVIKAIQDFNDTGIAWKLAALFGGAEALKVYWEQREKPQVVNDYYRRAGMTALFKAFGTGNHLRPVNKYNIDAITTHVLKFAEIEMQNAALTGRGGAISEDRTAMMKELMGSIQFFMAKPNDPIEQREPRLHEKVDQALLEAVVGEANV